MLGEASDPGLGVSFSRGGSAGSGGLEARPAALTCANARGMWTPPEMGMPNGRAVPRTSRGALRCMNWFILVLSTTTSEGHQTSGRSPPTSRWTKSTTGYAGFGLSAVLSPPPLHLARAAIFTIAPRALDFFVIWIFW